MLKIIYQASCIEVPHHDDGGVQLGWRVENILKAIEEAGMLPPTHHANKLYDRANACYYDENDWEPEE